MAAASIFIIGLSEDAYQSQTTSMQSQINVGSGHDVSIAELASMIAQIVDYEGQIVFDASKPDGSPRKLMNVDLLKSLGWNQQIDLTDGIQQTYRWFVDNQDNLRAA
jgi:GDP-L-fucose synthase